MTDSDSLPPLNVERCAFFFDLDGTLAPIEPRPELVAIPDNIKQTLSAIYEAAGGALALVSGRALSELDVLGAPLRGPAAGVHGAERRDGAGKIHRMALSEDTAKRLGEELSRVMASFPGSHVESKGMAFALHYRQAPQFQQDILALAATFVERYQELTLQPGKCVVELKPKGVDKGAAIAAFMQEAPFAGKTPLFMGDDLTDEAGFIQVNALNGISIKVGPGDTAARYHLHDVASVHQWLLSLATQPNNNSIKTKSAVGEDV